MNITKKWTPILAVGCSHGHLIDPDAAENILRFRWGGFNPKVVVHLGDAFDFTSLRSGAVGNPHDGDNAVDIDADVEDGLDFLRELEPTHYCYGNHEDRLNTFESHWNARYQHTGRTIKAAIRKELAKGVRILETWDQTSWFTFGGVRFGHGVYFGANFLRQSADAFGNCVIAHAHHPGFATGGRLDHPRALSVGCLRTIQTAGFAKARRATLAWGHGFVWGEFCDTDAALWVHAEPGDRKVWRLPS